MNFFHHSVESSTKTRSSSAGCPMSLTFADLSVFLRQSASCLISQRKVGRHATISIIQIVRQSAGFFFFFFFLGLVGVFF